MSLKRIPLHCNDFATSVERVVIKLKIVYIYILYILCIYKKNMIYNCTSVNVRVVLLVLFVCHTDTVYHIEPIKHSSHITSVIVIVFIGLMNIRLNL